MKLRELIKIIIMLGAIIATTSILLLSVLREEVGIKYVDCYDEYGHKILGLTCEQPFYVVEGLDEKWVALPLYLGIIFIVGGCMFFVIEPLLKIEY